jgi:hypothetical protein
LYVLQLQVAFVGVCVGVVKGLALFVGVTVGDAVIVCVGGIGGHNPKSQEEY